MYHLAFTRAGTQTKHYLERVDFRILPPRLSTGAGLRHQRANRHPDVGCLEIDTAKAWCGNADDRELLRSELHRSSNGARVCVELTAPECVGDHGDRIRARNIGLRR